MRSYLQLTCEYELNSLTKTKVSAAKDHGENCMKVGPPLVRHLLRNRLFSFENSEMVQFNQVRATSNLNCTVFFKLRLRSSIYYFNVIRIVFDIQYDYDVEIALKFSFHLHLNLNLVI